MAKGGVFPSPIGKIPGPPPGAAAIEIRDDAGRVIAACWVVGEHSDVRLLEMAWAWYDAHATGRPDASEGPPDLKLL